MNEALTWAFLFNIVLGVAMYFLKVNNEALRERIKNNEDALATLREDSLRWRDFNSFREELWARLDRMERSNTK